MKIKKIVLPEAPNVFKSILNGFDAITKHLTLLLFPVGLDLVLWFGPHLQLKSLIKVLIEDMAEESSLFSANFAEMMEAGREIWLVAAERINLFLALRSLPVGIFSLLTSILPVKNPLGIPLFWDIPSLGNAFLISVLLFIVGSALGGLYFAGVRQAALFDEVRWRSIFREWPRLSVQVLALGAIWLVLFLAVLIVGSCAATGFTLFSISLGQNDDRVGQMVIVLFGIIAFWLVFPLFFSPHGIFSGGQKAWRSLLISMRLTNLTFLKSSLFIVMAILVTQGLNMIWQIAPEDSWLMLISVAGHAFVTTGMLAASFVYYQDMLRWMEEIQKITSPKPVVEERPTLEK